MITFVYDRRGKYGFVPNLTPENAIDIKPKSQEWYDLALVSPYSQENRLLKYMRLEEMPFKEMNVSELPEGEIGMYLVTINLFDPEFDYFRAMPPETLAMLKDGRIRFVFYYSEGDPVQREILPHLMALCEMHEVRQQYVKFVSANAMSITYGASFIYFPDDELYYRYLHVFKKDYVTEVNLEERSKILTVLNRVDKPWRKLFAASLWQHGLHHKSYFSYNNVKYTTPHVGNEEDDPYGWSTYWHDSRDLMQGFDLHTPFKCDDLTDDEQNDHTQVQIKYFQDAYWQVVPETHLTNDTIFITEKTFKCILNMQPFIILGNPQSLNILHQMGYHTFHEFIGEEYDTIDNNEARMCRVFAEVYALAQRSHDAHVSVQRHLKPLLEFNQQHFLASKKERLVMLIQLLYS